MKIRMGFVSNSSSSSFVISKDEIDDRNLNTIKVLKEFLIEQKKEILEWANYDATGKGIDPKAVKKAEKAYDDVFEWIAANQDTKKNPTFMFPSCNYDTYIWKLSTGQIKINTCNNTNWTTAAETLNAEWVSDGSDEDDWPEMPMAKQPADWNPEFLYNRPDESKIIILKQDTKYQDLPILYNPPENKCRFTALLEE